MAAAAADDMDMSDGELNDMATAYRPVVDEDTLESFLLYECLFVFNPRNIRQLAQVTPMFDRIVDSLPDQDYDNQYVQHLCAVDTLSEFVHVSGDAIDVFFPYVGRLVQHLARTVESKLGIYEFIQVTRTTKLLGYFSTEPAALDEMLAATPDTVNLLTDVSYLLSTQPEHFATAKLLLDRVRDKQAQGRVKACR